MYYPTKVIEIRGCLGSYVWKEDTKKWIGGGTSAGDPGDEPLVLIPKSSLFYYLGFLKLARYEVL